MKSRTRPNAFEAGLYMISVVAIGVVRREGPSGSNGKLALAMAPPDEAAKSLNCAVAAVVALRLLTAKPKNRVAGRFALTVPRGIQFTPSALAYPLKFVRFERCR